MEILFLGGLKHSGKTSLGKLVAADLGYSFFDLDDLVIQAGGGGWSSIRQIWQKIGRSGFQHLEEDAARDFVEWTIPSLGGHGIVLALGGGTAENPGAMSWLMNRGFNVYIQADAELLYGRIMTKGRPPFLSENDPHGDFIRLFKRRDPLYTDFANLIHRVDDSSKQTNARRLLVSLEQYDAGK